MKRADDTDNSIETAGVPGGHSAKSSRGAWRPLIPRAITFVLLFLLWVVLSGKLDAFHLGLGVFSCLLITYVSGDLLFPEGRATGFFRTCVRLFGYLPWLMVQIFLANLHVLYLVFHPRMMELIDPRMIRFRSRLRSDLALLTFGNSITLTPGTITVYISRQRNFTVHGIDRKSWEGLPGEMEERIARVFGEQ